MTNETSATRRPLTRPDGGALRFPRQSRVLSSADFRQAYDKGFRLSNPLFAAFCLARPEPRTSARLGLTTPRALGKSVIRNRLKRRLREAFRLHAAEIAPQWDLVLNPRRAMLAASFSEIEQALGKVIAQCNSRS